MPYFNVLKCVVACVSDSEQVDAAKDALLKQCKRAFSMDGLDAGVLASAFDWRVEHKVTMGGKPAALLIRKSTASWFLHEQHFSKKGIQVHTLHTTHTTACCPTSQPTNCWWPQAFKQPIPHGDTANFQAYRDPDGSEVEGPYAANFYNMLAKLHRCGHQLDWVGGWVGDWVGG